MTTSRINLGSPVLYALQPKQTQETTANHLKYLFRVFAKLEHALKSYHVDLTKRNVEVLKQTQHQLRLKIDYLKANLSLLSSEKIIESIDHERIFEAAESLNIQLFSTELDLLYFQRFQLTRLLANCKQKSSVEELRNLLGATPHPAIERLYFSVWLHHRTPYISDYGKKTLFNDPHLLLEIKDPFFFPKGENIIEQLIFSFEEEIHLEEAAECCHALDNFNKMLRNDPHGLEKQSFLEKFHLLPEKVRLEIFKIVDLENLESNPFVLLSLKNPELDSSSKHIIEQLISLYKSEQICIKNERQKNQIQLFMKLYDSARITHKQLKKIYKRLDDEVKTQVPAPPYFGHGVHFELYEILGAHPTPIGTVFRVMAPNAKNVSLALRAYGDDEHVLPMIKDPISKYWELQTEQAFPGRTYQYVIETNDGRTLRKADPFAFGFMPYNDPF